MISQLERPQQRQLQPPKFERQAAMNFLRRAVLDARVHIAVLFALVFICFGRTLGSFFLADDFGEVRYVSQIFNGQPGLIWANLTGPYLQNPTILVWRPWMHISQVIDYALWGARPFGYYLTNLLYASGTVAFFYLALRQLTDKWPKANSITFALLAAALFAVSPLHCESISWMVGRVDILCAFFCLLSLNLYLIASEKQGRLNTILGTIAFWLALGSKEMAVGLPLVTTAAFFFIKEQSLKEAFKFTRPLWISLGVYFVLRMAFLGTIGGGYTGDIGAVQGENILQRWLDPDTVSRLLYPFSIAVYKNGGIYKQALDISYFAIAILAAFKLLVGRLPLKWLAFLAIWSVTAVAPIYKLWGLGHNLEGARYYFFLTLPLAVLAPLLVLHPFRSESKEVISLHKKLAVIALLGTIALIPVFGKVAYSTNLLWVHAGKEVRSFWKQCQNVAESLPSGKRVAMLGIPKRNGGAHMILNALTFQFMMSPPFTNKPMHEKFSVFDPVYFTGESPYINATAFKNVTQDPKTTAIFVWKGQKEGFARLQVQREVLQQMPFDLIPYTVDQIWQVYTKGHQKTVYLEKSTVILQQVKQDDGLRFFNLAINPVDWDFLEFELRRAPSDKKITLKATWNGDDEAFTEMVVPASDTPDKFFRRVRLPLSNSWRWFAYPRIRELQLLLPDLDELEIRHIRLISDRTVAPRISLPGLQQNFANIAAIKSPKSKLVYIGKFIENATRTELQISKPGYFFDNFSEEQIPSIIGKTILSDNTMGDVVLDNAALPKNGYYQIRARCLDADGLQVGEYSDALTVRVNR